MAQKTALRADEERILSLLPYYHCLTEQQLRRLLGRKSPTTFNPLLKGLVEKGYVHAIRAHMNSPYTYFLTTRKGVQWARNAGIPVTIQRPPAKIADMEHTRLVNDALISFHLLCQTDPAFQIVSLTHERDFKVKPLPLPNDRSLAPDAWLELHWTTTTRQKYRFAVEVQGTSHWTNGIIRAKARKYLTLEEKEIYKAYFSLPEQASFIVLFLALGGAAKAAGIKQAIEQELEQQGKQDDFADMFAIAPLLTDTIVYNAPVWQQPFAEAQKPLWDWL